ncbi:hypothetical protein I552_1813 [Mycobacterium xenopi 3993]|nr:hypothetical protein I552_1813 [Mycobacterium xenopi 3993]
MIDKIVAAADADAVRRRTQHQNDREVWIGDLAEGGISEIHGRLFTTDAHALDKRLDVLAATVCEHDPRSRQQRRADALGALAAGSIGWGAAVDGPIVRPTRAGGSVRRRSCDRGAGWHRRQRLCASLVS